MLTCPRCSKPVVLETRAGRPWHVVTCTDEGCRLRARYNPRVGLRAYQD